MRSKSVPQPLSSLIRDVLSSTGLDTKLEQGIVIAAWEDVIGEKIGEHIEKTWFKDGRLFVRIKSPVWRQELHLNRTSWCRRLNEELGRDAVKDIVFR